MKLFFCAIAIAMVLPHLAYALEAESGDSNISVEGSKTISFSYQEFQGDANQTRRLNGLQRRESTRLNLSGQLQKKIKFMASFLTTDNPLSEDQISVQLATDHLKLDFGDINASFKGSEFTLFNRQIFGARLTGDYKKVDFSLIASRPKGEQKYIKFYGNDSQGPFQLGERIVEGSENIKINNQEKIKGRDYEIDYLIGEIRFKSMIVEDTDLLEIEYEFQTSGSERRLYGGRFVHHPAKFFSYGISILDDRDKKDRTAFETQGTAPTAISASSLDVAFRPLKGWEAKGEVAGSLYQPNLFSPENKTEGIAWRGEGSGVIGPVNISGGMKRVRPEYTNPGSLSLRQDMTSRNAKARFKHKGRFSTAISYKEEDFINLSERQNILRTQAEAAFTPIKFPHLDYIFSRRDEKDTAVGFTEAFQIFRETSHRGKISKNFKYLGTSFTGEQTERTDFPGLPPREISQAGKIGLSLKNIRRFSAGASAELRQNLGKDQELEVYKDLVQTYNLTLTFKPVKNYQVTARGLYRQDSRQGWFANADGNYSAKMSRAISSSGSYRLEFLKQRLLLSEERTIAHTGNFNVKTLPFKNLGLDYRSSFRLENFKNQKMAFSRHRRDSSVIRYAPLNSLSLSGEYSRDNFWIVYAQDTSLPPQLTQTNQVVGGRISWIFSKKMRSTSSYRLTVLDEERLEFELLPTLSYEKRTNRVHSANQKLSYQISKKFTANGGYSYSATRQRVPGAENTENPVYPFGTESYLMSASTDNIKVDQHGGSLGLDYNVSSVLSLSAGGGYSLTKDSLALGRNQSHTLSSNAGLSANLGKGTTWTTKYTYAKSRGQVHTERHTSDTNLGLRLSKEFSWTTSGSYTAQRFPYLSTTTIRSNLNLRF